jgi:hypothetical protein
MKLQIHHIDGNPLNNDPANLRRVRVATNRAAPIKRPRGRPELSPDQRLVIGSLRLTGAQWAKLEALGGAVWLRDRINRAKLKASGT